MAKLTVLITENIPTSLRGELTRWMLEIKSGIFVGTLSALVREKLWDKACEKIMDGGAFLIHPMNNEQKFGIQTHGNTDRTIVDLDGIKLIRIPIKKRSRVKKFPKEKIIERITREDSSDLKKDVIEDFLSISPGFSHSSKEIFPKNFIWRMLKIKNYNTHIDFNYQGLSTYSEVIYTDIWQDEWKSDLEIISNKIIKLIRDTKGLKDKISGKNIISIDIETTDYLPKAYEGFVNIIGIACLSLKSNAKEPELVIHQIFNITRKKDLAFHLLNLLKTEISRADSCVVFNKEFDLKILNKIIKENELKISFPDDIIDLNEKFSKLIDLEIELESQTGFHRKQTDKSKFSDYYKLFKGIGRKGINKKLEPIGSYNLIDTLTPLLYYLLNP